jgi:hypothetical protein
LTVVFAIAAGLRLGQRLRADAEGVLLRRALSRCGCGRLTRASGRRSSPPSRCPRARRTRPLRASCTPTIMGDFPRVDGSVLLTYRVRWIDDTGERQREELDDLEEANEFLDKLEEGAGQLRKGPTSRATSIVWDTKAEVAGTARAHAPGAAHARQLRRSVEPAPETPRWRAAADRPDYIELERLKDEMLAEGIGASTVVARTSNRSVPIDVTVESGSALVEHGGTRHSTLDRSIRGDPCASFLACRCTRHPTGPPATTLPG